MSAGIWFWLLWVLTLIFGGWQVPYLAGDGWHIPFAASATVRTTPKIDLSLTFGWPSLVQESGELKRLFCFGILRPLLGAIPGDISAA